MTEEIHGFSEMYHSAYLMDSTDCFFWIARTAGHSGMIIIARQMEELTGHNFLSLVQLTL